jgi:hypothetical protein
MGKVVISVSSTFEPLSIRDSSPDVGYFYVTDVMTGSMVAMKNTCE